MSRENSPPAPDSSRAPPDRRRRLGGARHEASERVTARLASAPEGTPLIDGWTLNLSRGGVRVIVEQGLVLGELYELTIGDSDNQAKRMARVAWIQNEADGQICGLEFLDGSGSGAPPPSTRPREEP